MSMRRFKIGIDGVDYDVTVEELDESESIMPSTRILALTLGSSTHAMSMGLALRTMPFAI